MQVALSHGLLYNPQGQGIIECAHRTLTECLEKQKGRIGYGRTPKDRIALALFTLNFLNLDPQNRSAAEQHSLQCPQSTEMVKWKDILSNQWFGPDPIITRSRGAVCVFLQDWNDPIWVSERLTRKVKLQESGEDAETSVLMDVDPDTSSPPRDDREAHALGHSKSLTHTTPCPKPFPGSRSRQGC